MPPIPGGGSLSVGTCLHESGDKDGEETDFFDILIKDSGAGVLEGDIEKIYTPFF